VDKFPTERLLEGGIVDYVLGAQPGGGVFVIGYNEDKIQQGYLNYYKMGEGPFYVFYVPYHLCHFEAPMSVARAVLYGDATTAPLGGAVVEVVTAAKKDMKAGELLDGIGKFTSYGLAENADVCREQNLLPMGLSEGCRLKRDVGRDEVLSYADIELPAGRLADRLRQEQEAYFA
jgi:predicted homoserine dehydrogenase-like protein